ncbi:MAG: SURF1 family protein [Gemmatimonadales bacterium]
MSSRARLAVIICFGLAAVVFARLGFWQMNRLREQRAANVVALEARSAPRIRLDSAAPITAELDGREVSATGHYDHEYDIVLRGKAYGGSPGVEVATPLVLQGGRMAVLVNRGFLPSPDAVTAQTDSVRELGRVRVEGTALSLPSGGGAPLDRSGHTTWARLDRKTLAARLPYEVAPVYIRQAPDSALPRFPRRLEPLPIDDGPHLSYAIQWFAFAGMAIVFGIVILRTKRVSGKR